MDRLVFCGKPQPFMRSVAGLYAHWPVSEEDFAFGQPSGQRRRTDEEQGLLDHMKGDSNDYYGILVRGFEIWAGILKWVVGGVRRLPGMSLPKIHPWVEGSPWRLLYDELQAWTRLQDRRLHYVEGSPSNHAALGQAGAFYYLNLISYVSLIFLEQEYMLFLPASENKPPGPVHPPLLPISAPSGWWHDRADELFTTAAKILSLMQELENAYREGTGGDTQAWTENVPGDWCQSWPLWGQQQNLPYEVGGYPLIITWICFSAGNN
ncbi:hypothetical protein QQX98_002885 [Neonectria punicea]|uniref:Uncharacterized protein n=1 Tax=Neonectria punicea TaxID=979145 RepID=A0ABR1HH53_9HYPO